MRPSSVRTALAVSFLMACGTSGGGGGGADAGNGPDGPSGGGTSQTIDASGGTITFEGVTLEIPPGALDAPQTITIDHAADPAPNDITPLTPIYRFGPDGLQFRLPIRVTMKYDGGADDAVVYWSDGSGGWDQSGMIGVEADGAVTTEELHFSSGFVSHLTRWRLQLCDDSEVARGKRAGCQGQPGDICLDNFPQFPVQYVFVLMMENHSFDNYFGRFQAYLKKKGYSDDRTADGGLEVPATPYDLLDPTAKAAEDAKVDICSYDAKKDAPYNPPRAAAGAKGSCDKHYWRHANGDGEQCVSDTCHEWWCAHLQVDGGRMDGFFQSNDGFWEGAEPDVGKGPYAKEPIVIPDGWYDRAKYPDGLDGTQLRGDRAMLYYDETDIPFYYWLADSFGLADHYHASVTGPTYVNRDYLYGATSRGLTSNSSDNYGDGATSFPGPYRYAGSERADPEVIHYRLGADQPPKPIDTIYDDLDVRGVGWTQWVRNRYSNVAAVAKYGTWYGSGALVADKHKYTYDKQLFGGNGFEAYVQAENAALLKKIAKGANPATLQPQGSLFPVNFIDPDPLEDVNGEDEHPPGTPQMGQRLSYDVVRVLMSNPEVWKRSVLFITWDEHGGFYDHVNPPPACAPDNLGPKWSGAYGGGAHTPYSDAAKSVPRQGLVVPDNTDKLYTGGFDQLGVRVPLLVISPWAKHRHVSHNIYDHTSILRFLEARFGMPALTRRDANADPLFEFFDFNLAPQKLRGEVAGWAGESLPADGVYADAASLGTNASSPAVRYRQQANATCVSLFAPLASPGLGSDLSTHVYGSYDWSRGYAPPPKLTCGGGGGGGGCCSATPCPLNYKWCNSDCKCEMALQCPSGDIILGGCECCAAWDPIDPLTCTTCDSKSDVFSTYCPAG